MLQANPEDDRYKNEEDDWDLEDEAARYYEGDEKRDHFHDQNPPKIHLLASILPPYTTNNNNKEKKEGIASSCSLYGSSTKDKEDWRYVFLFPSYNI